MAAGAVRSRAEQDFEANEMILSGNIGIVDNTSNVGQYGSLALDSSDRPIIGYLDKGNLDLKLAATRIESIDDFNSDCQVNFLDLAEMCSHWLECTVPFFVQ